MSGSILKFTVVSILMLACTSTGAYAQLGKFKDQIKQKGLEMLKEEKEGNRDILKEIISEETAKKQQGYDTTSFQYAIAFLDKSESFEDKQKGEGMVKTAGFLMRNPDSITEKDKARDLFELGRINYNRRMYKMAEQNLVAAALAYELLNETSDPIYLKSLGLLGLLYSDMGRYEKAEEYTFKAMEGWEAASGTSSQGYIAELNNSGILLMSKAHYADAETTLQSASNAIKSTLGEKSVPYAITLNNLGILYQYMGRSDEALKSINKCVEIAGTELRGKSSTYIQLLTNKALVQQENKLYADAEKTYLDAKQLQETKLKLGRKSDPDYAHLLNNMASLYLLKGDLAQAENYLKTSLDIYTSKFGDEHPLVAEANADLGNLYRYQSRYKDAEPLIAKAKKTMEAKYGADHPKSVQATEDLAIVKWKSGQLDEADKLFEEIMAKSMAFINTYFPPLSEVEKTKYWDKLKPRFDLFFNFAFDNTSSNPSLFTKAIEYRMATKGLLLSTSTKIKNSILASNDAELIKLYLAWQDQKQLLAIYYSMTKEEIADQKINVDSVQRAANSTERQLSAKSADFAGAFATSTYTYDKLAKSLKPDQALVEIVHYPAFENAFTGESRYAALIVKNGSTMPTLVQFDTKAQMDKKSYSAYRNMIRIKADDNISYGTYWQPIEHHLVGTSQVIFSPDGVYSQLNVNTLKSDDNKFVIDKYTIRNIGNPADLLALASTKAPTKEAFLMGFPEYGSPAIAPLPGTLKEVTSIGTMLKTNGYKSTIKTGMEATETEIKKIKSTGLIHIATHGYFMEDVGASSRVFGVQVEYARNNPLLRSGLMLTGASKSLNTTNVAQYDQNDNGILTAYEAINLPLDGTELVVLSACETGKGDIKSGEGVYGLQRAFKIAGAGRTLMSLWKVDDEATQQLMSAFYTAWTKEKQSPEVAFRKAQLAIKSKFPEPYYWGAFVMME